MRSRRLHPLLPFRLAYFTFFVYLGTFSPFWTAYLRQGLGFSQEATGLFYGTYVAAALAAASVLSLSADRWRRRRALQRLTSLAGIATCALFAFVREAHAVASLTVLHGFAAGAQIPLLDAATIDALGPERRRFGVTRLFGTLGFGTGMAIAAGLRTEGAHCFVAVLAAAMAVHHLATWLLPDTQAPRSGTPASIRRRDLLAIPEVALLLGAVFLHGAGFGHFDPFAVIHFDALGFGPRGTVLLYGLGLASEVVVFFVAARLFRLAPAAPLLALSLLLTALRWATMIAADDLGVVAAVQLLHGVGFGLFYGASLHLLGGLVDLPRRTVAQGLFSVALGSGMGAGALLAGALRERFGAAAAFGSATSVALAAFALALPLARRIRHPQ